MFLRATVEQNPELVAFAARQHIEGTIAPNTYVIDADSVAKNAARTAEAGRREGIKLNVMTKQFGRNPRVSRLISDAGLTRFVAVDVEEARVLWHAGLDVAHVGHLVGTASYDVAEVVAHHPEAITVFNLEQAERINLAARQTDLCQSLLLRMYDPDGGYHPCQEGGFLLSELDIAISRLAQLTNLSVLGVTTHPCLDYEYETGKGGPTANLALLRAAASKLTSVLGTPIEINAPGATCIATLPLLKESGATTGEPGSSLTGTTPLHSFTPQPEVPAIVYVSEVSHCHGRRVFTFGGGFYRRGHVLGALVGRSGDIPSVRLPAVAIPPEAIDYYGELTNERDEDIRVGDTVIYAFRNQVFVTRGRVAVVEGLAGGSPRVTGIYDGLGGGRAEP